MSINYNILQKVINHDELTKIPDPYLVILFGASGDLAKRKVLPAIYNLFLEGILPQEFSVLGISRSIKNSLAFKEIFFDSIVKYSAETWNIDKWDVLSKNVFGIHSDFYNEESFNELKAFIQEINEKLHLNGRYMFYLATAPANYSIVIEKLYNRNLLTRDSRIVIEKPFGLDLRSAQKLNNELLTYLTPEQIFRIDHYLGKEPIQNILVFRKNNPLFSSIWSNKSIGRIEIIVAETVGVDKRTDYFEQTGILRDMIQSHLLQILALLTMKIPETLEPELLIKNKVELLKSVRKFTEEEVLENSIRGQYDNGRVVTPRSGDHQVKAYREENGVNIESNVETFVALKLFIDNDTWKNVPFYLIAGKRMKSRLTEVRIRLKENDSHVYEPTKDKNDENHIRLRIQPNPSIIIQIRWKPPGILSQITPIDLEIKGNFSNPVEPKAYERLLLDVMYGDHSAFVSQQEIEEQWKIVEPFLYTWKKHPPTNFPNYIAGTFGPEEVEEWLPRFSF